MHLTDKICDQVPQLKTTFDKWNNISSRKAAYIQNLDKWKKITHPY